MMLNDRSSTINLLLSRRSAKAREMAAPGPDREEARVIAAAGLRVPDHGKLGPWRLILVEAADQPALGAAFARVHAQEAPDAAAAEVAAIAAFPCQAPLLIAVLSRPVATPAIPAWEQQLSAGALCQNMLLAAHALGYAGCWLTGWPAYSEGIVAALGGDAGDRVAGFLFFGTPGKPVVERPRPDFDAIVSVWKPL